MRLNETNQTKIRGVEHPHIFDKISRYFVFYTGTSKVGKKGMYFTYL